MEILKPGQITRLPELVAGRVLDARLFRSGDRVTSLTVIHSPYIDGNGELVADFTNSRGRTEHVKVSDLSLGSDGKRGKFYLTIP